jgi:hypothetical protein
MSLVSIQPSALIPILLASADFMINCVWTAESLAAELEVTVDELYDMMTTGPLRFLLSDLNND